MKRCDFPNGFPEEDSALESRHRILQHISNQSSLPISARSQNLRCRRPHVIGFEDGWSWHSHLSQSLRDERSR